MRINWISSLTLFNRQYGPAFQADVFPNRKPCMANALLQGALMADTLVPVVVDQATDNVDVVLTQLAQDILRVRGEVHQFLFGKLLQRGVFGDFNLKEEGK